MKIPLHRSDAALSLFGALIIFALIVLIGGLAIKILLDCVDGVPPPMPPPGRDTNIVAVISQSFHNALESSNSMKMPAFEFSAGEVATLDAETFLSRGEIVIERSTNLMDWTPAWRLSSMNEFNLASDTNPPAPACFYRAVLVR